jgi:hypothetical protein
MGLLQWKAGSTALFHNVYFGVTPDLGPAQLVSERLYFTVTVYFYLAGVVPGTTYYWRVDEIDKDGVTVYTGDVWSFTAWPFTSFLPDPKDGSNTAAVSPLLKWVAGRGASKHHVYLGDSKAAVTDGAAEADKGIVTDPNYAAGELQPVTTYYWRVDEVAADGKVTAGNVWSFTTVLSIDDFESYTNEVGSRVFQTWIDGWGYNEPAPGDPGNGTGASVGHDIWAAGTAYTTIAETKITHNGSKQSMPLDYNNINAPYYSEAERTWTTSQDWTANDVNMLTLHIQGMARDVDILSVTTPPVIDGKIDDIWSIASIQTVKTKIDGEDLTGPDDASSQFRVLYDAQNLYALVEVKDATLVNDSANSWQDDSVEFYIDGDNSKAGSGLSGNNRQYTFGWTTTDVQGTNTALDGVVHAQSNVTGGWQIELKFPWQSLRGTGAPVGKLIGVDSFYNDDDNGADTRETQIAWHSTIGDDWETAADWGTALVVPASAGGTDRLYVTLRDASNHTGTVICPRTDVVMSKQWFEWTIPLSDFAAAGVNLSAVRKMSIGIGDRANPTAGSAGPIFIDDIYLTKPGPKP